MLWIITSVLIIILDQIIKWQVVQNIQPGSAIEVIPSFFYITNYSNTGAAWSILQNQRIFLTIVPSIVIIVIGYFFFTTKDRLLRFPLACILGGAMGNLIDRMIKGSVTDFLEFHFGTYVFPIFNVADSFVVIGSILLCIVMLWMSKKSPTADKIE